MDIARLTAVAFRFLTRLPLPEVGYREGDLRRATPAFPLVGVVVGALGAGVYAGSNGLLGALPAATIAVAVTVAVTGAFHEDGLADVADGFWGGYTPERRLEIMRDSRVGTFGAAAVALSLLLRVVLVGSLTVGAATEALVVAHALGAGSVLLAVRVTGPADAGSSGAAVAEPVGVLGLLAGTSLAVVPAVAAFGRFAVGPVVVAVVVTVATALVARAKVGGLTGDVLGAANQMVLLGTLATAVGLTRAGLQ